MSINLLNFTPEQLSEYFVQIGEKPYRAVQLLQWVHQLGITDFSQMSNFSLRLRTYLAEHAELTLPTISDQQISSDWDHEMGNKII